MAKQRNVIAIVDDNPALRRALQRLLQALDYRTEMFASADEFLNAAATSKGACLLVDIAIGSDSGLELVRRLSEAGFSFPVIFMSARDGDVVRKQAMNVGARAYLLKPFPAAQLIDEIEKAIGSNTRLG
jgi:FixJ family two-component response regulator